MDLTETGGPSRPKRRFCVFRSNALAKSQLKGDKRKNRFSSKEEECHETMIYSNGNVCCKTWSICKVMFFVLTLFVFLLFCCVLCFFVLLLFGKNRNYYCLERIVKESIMHDILG